ncbi:MAG: (2Fe-2S)-binding protein [Coriobacteriales bacterium]|jgi:bacterioferritin-associated ferredoxin
MEKIVRHAPTEPFKPMPDDDMIVCRCEEITKGEIRKAVYDGMTTMNEVKRWLRCGMGLCQGQTCQRNVLGIISRESGIPIAELGQITGRSPVRPTVMEVFSNDVFDVDEEAVSNG